jgi:5-methylcytosine-specific restriction endonuclease McrA
MGLPFHPQQPGPTRKQLKGRKLRTAAKVRKSVRGQVVARAEGCCERCGAYVGDAGHAHHRIPRSRGGRWTVRNIQLVCPGCHVEAHLTNTL